MAENIILSKRNKKKLRHDGHLFIFDKFNTEKDKKFWKCELSGNKDFKCKARLHTDLEDNVQKTLNVHVCNTDAANIEVQRIKTGIKRRAEETMEAPNQIRARALQDIATPVLAQVPSRNATNQLIKRVRKEVAAPPAIPIDIEHLEIPEAYRSYTRTENQQQELFLLADSGVYIYTEVGQQGSHRILIFGRMSSGNWAADMKYTYVDGTFSTAPVLFYQIFALLARRRNWVFPVLYGLLTTKTTASYARFFRMIKNIWPLFNPHQMSMDFEPAIIAAAQEVFPGVQVAGCFFHLVRNFKKAISTNGLTQRFNGDTQFSLDAKMITSMAFLSIADITQGIIALENYLPPELQPVLDWFLTNYTGRLRHDGTRTQPRYDPSIWNVHQRVLRQEDRTNNYCEAAHRKLQRAFGCTQPSIWRFIDTLREQQKAIDADFAACQQGREPPPKCKKYRNADRGIMNLVQNYRQLNVEENHDHQYIANPNPNLILDFLKGISHNYNMDP